MAVTPEQQIRDASTEAKSKSLAALNEGQSESKRLTQQAQEAVKAQQKDALNRLLADARTRGFTGDASVLQGEMVGGSDRRVQSMSEGMSARDRDYEARKAALGELYGRIEALAPQLAAQAAMLGGRGGGGGGGRGGRGGGGGSGGGDWSTQFDVFDELMDRIQQTDEDRTTMEYERFFENLGGLPRNAQQAGLALWRASGGDLPFMQQNLAAPEDPAAMFRVLSKGARQGRGLFAMIPNAARKIGTAASSRNALQRALDDAIRNQRRVQTSTQARTQQTQRDKTNSRSRQSGLSGPHRAGLRR